jgi:hypothetical protein
LRIRGIASIQQVNRLDAIGANTLGE